MAQNNFYTGSMKMTTDTSCAKPKTTKPTTRKPSRKKSIEDKDKPENDTKDDTEDKDEKGSAEDVSSENGNVDEGEEGSNEEEDTEKEEPEKEEKPSTLKDLIEQTKTVVTTKKLGTEPSGLSEEPVDSDKIKVNVKNDKGSIEYILWIKPGTTPPKTEEVIKDVTRAVSSGEGVSTLEDFRQEFGFTNAEETRATKAFDCLRKAIGTMKKMFPDGLYEQLKDFSGECVTESEITCEVIKEEDNKYGVYDNMGRWLASFPSEDLAMKFSEDYPEMYRKYVES